MDEMRDDGHQPATKADLRATQVELRCMRLDHGANLRRLNIGFAQMRGDMAEMKANLDSLLVLKDEFSQFKNNIERMTNYFEAQVRKTDFLGSMMMEHEDRIKKLESRPS